MRISIVVDNYNYEQYLGQAIESALTQTWDDCEVLVIDDGSTDGSRAIIEAFGQRIRPIFQPNGGQASAFNAAVEHVSGDVTIFLDADDVLDETAAAQAASAFMAEPHLSRLQWSLRIVDASGVPTGRLSPEPAVMPTGDLRMHILKYRTHIWPATSGNAYATKVLRQVLPIPDDFRLGADLYLAETTALFGTIRSLPNPAGSYRIHGANSFSGGSLDVANLHQRIAWTLASHAYVYRYARSLGLPAPESATAALDVAFLSQRLASLRLDPVHHPVFGDHRLSLTTRGIWAAIRHPLHTRKHKAKRIVWLIGVGLGPKRLAHRWIERFYFTT